MSDIINSNKNIALDITKPTDHDLICKIRRALSVPDRLKILLLLNKHAMNLLEISRELSLPVSSVYNHTKALEEAQLIFVNYQPGPKGHTKMCSKMFSSLKIDMFAPDWSLEETQKAVRHELPIGLFTECSVTAPCGMAGKERIIEHVDDPRIFFSAQRTEAELLWFSTGYVSYDFPNLYPERKFSEVEFSFEICSETVYYREKWPSDITILINGKEALIYTSPGDFGGRRGKYSPVYWNINSTQFGLLKTVTVNRHGVYLDGVLQHTRLTYDDLNISKDPSIKLTFMIKEDARYHGGINLFGKAFGDYPQAIVMSLT